MEDGVNVPEQNENSNDVINESEVDPFDQLIGGFQEKTAQSNVVQNQPQVLFFIIIETSLFQLS